VHRVVRALIGVENSWAQFGAASCRNSVPPTVAAGGRGRRSSDSWPGDEREGACAPPASAQPERGLLPPERGANEMSATPMAPTPADLGNRASSAYNSFGGGTGATTFASSKLFDVGASYLSRVSVFSSFHLSTDVSKAAQCSSSSSRRRRGASIATAREGGQIACGKKQGAQTARGKNRIRRHLPSRKALILAETGRSRAAATGPQARRSSTPRRGGAAPPGRTVAGRTTV